MLLKIFELFVHSVFNGDKSLSDVNVTATSFVVLHVAEETLASCVLHLVNSSYKCCSILARQFRGTCQVMIA
ncbi:GSCOCG00004917001-RA-CDS [Cotesia congregata]|nr:GSCOCG00004917001-RA-CDS [Cotesia congregata]